MSAKTDRQFREWYQLPLRMRLRAKLKPVNELRSRLELWHQAAEESQRRQALELRMYNQRERAIHELAPRTDAEVRAERLLLDHLDKDQKRSYLESHQFEVLSQRHRVYRIMYGQSMNVHRLKRDGTIYAAYCAGPIDVPTCDTMLAQAILLKCDEDYFLGIAHSAYY